MADEREDQEPEDDALEEKAREKEEEGGPDEGIEEGTPSEERLDSAFDPDRGGVSPPAGTQKPA